MTLLTKKTDGVTKRCTSHCHNAKHKKCHCICGGEFHGIGEEQAIEKAVKSDLQVDQKVLYQHKQLSLI